MLGVIARTAHLPELLGAFARFLRDVGFPIFVASVLLWAALVQFPRTLDAIADKFTVALATNNDRTERFLAAMEARSDRRAEESTRRILEAVRDAARK